MRHVNILEYLLSFLFLSIPTTYLFSLFEYILSYRQNKFFSANRKPVILNQLKQAKERISRENLWCFMDEMAYTISYLTLS